MESSDPNERKKKNRVIVGHNVGFDRSYIREQYFFEVPNLKYLINFKNNLK